MIFEKTFSARIPLIYIFLLKRKSLQSNYNHRTCHVTPSTFRTRLVVRSASLTSCKTRLSTPSYRLFILNTRNTRLPTGSTRLLSCTAHLPTRSTCLSICILILSICLSTLVSVCLLVVLVVISVSLFTTDLFLTHFSPVSHFYTP